MSTDVTQWLESESPPRHIYEMLGRPVLDADRAGLLEAIRAADHRLIEFRKDPDPVVVKRALALLHDLEHARASLEDPTKASALDEQVVQALRQEYERGHGPNALGDTTCVVGWLITDHGLDAAAAARVADKVVGPASAPAVSLPGAGSRRKPDTPASKSARPAPASQRGGTKAPASARPSPDARRPWWPTPLDPEPEEATAPEPTKPKRQRRRDPEPIEPAPKRRRYLIAGLAGAAAIAAGIVVVLSLGNNRSEPSSGGDNKNREFASVPKGSPAAPDATPEKKSLPAVQPNPPQPNPVPPKAQPVRLDGADPASIAAREAITAITFSPDKRRIVTGGRDKAVRLWDAATGEQVRVFAGDSSGVAAVAISPDGRRLLSAGDESFPTVRLWDVDSGNELKHFDRLLEKVTAVGFLPPDRQAMAFGSDERALIAGGSLRSGVADNALVMVNLSKGSTEKRLEGHSQLVVGMTLSNDGKRALTSGADRFLRLWDLSSGSEVVNFRKGNTTPTSLLAFSANGMVVAVGDSAGTIRVLETSGGREIARTSLASFTPRALAMIGNGPQVAAAGQNGVRIWNAETNEVRRRSLGQQSAVGLSSDGLAAMMVSRQGKDQLDLTGSASFEIERAAIAAGPKKGPPAAAPGPIVGKRSPVPSESDRQAAQKDLLRRLAAEFQKSTTPQQKLELANTLREDALGASQIPARYAALWEAKEVAVSAGSPRAAFPIIDDLAEEFEINAQLLRVEAVESAVTNARPFVGASELFDYSLIAANAALESDSFELVDRALKAARTAADGALPPRNQTYRKLADSWATHVRSLAKEYPAIQQAEATLKSDPKGPAANQRVGYYRCVLKGIWDEPGLKLLAAGNHAKLQPLAKLELAHPAGAVRQAQLADGWYAAATDEAGRARTHLLMRAAYWYSQARSQLEESKRIVAGRRIREADQEADAIGLHKPSQPILTAVATEDPAAPTRTLHVKVKLAAAGTLSISPEGSVWSRSLTYGEWVMVNGFPLRQRTLKVDPVQPASPLGPAFGWYRPPPTEVTGHGLTKLLGNFQFSNAQVAKSDKNGSCNVTNLGGTLQIQLDVEPPALPNNPLGSVSPGIGSNGVPPLGTGFPAFGPAPLPPPKIYEVYITLEK